jgi:hypothetical protein
MDVVLYAKNIDKPDLNVLEISLVKIASESDQFVEVKDKIIVALTQGEKTIPMSNNTSLLTKSKEAWARLGVHGSRIIPVFSKAELEKSSATKDCPEIKDTNMEFLKKTVSECVVESRFKFTEKRLKSLRKKIDVNVKALKGYIKEDFEINFDGENDGFDENEDEDKMEFAFRKEWEKTKDKFIEFFQQTFTDSFEIENNEELFEGFKIDVDKSFEELLKFVKDVNIMKTFYNRNITDRGIISAAEGNTQLRKHISDEAKKCILNLSNKLGEKF